MRSEHPTPPDDGMPEEAPSVSSDLEALFLSARQDPADVLWARRAIMTLALHDVQIDVADTAVRDVADLVAESRESPEELFGPADSWARRRVAEMRGEGLPVFEDPLRMGPRQTAVLTLCGAAALSGMFVVSNVFALLPGRGVSELTLGYGLAPLLISAAIALLITVYTRAVRRFSFGVTAVLCAGALALCSTSIALIIMPLAEIGPRANGWWAALLVPFYALLCWFLMQLWPAASSPAAPASPVTVAQILAAGDLPDDEWLERAQAALRARGDLTERRIRVTLREAREHAQDEGKTLIAEFSSPEGYAQSLPRDPRVKPRRMTLLYGMLTLVWAALGISTAVTDDGQPWRLVIFAILVLLCGWTTVSHARTWRSAAMPEGRPQQGSTA